MIRDLSTALHAVNVLEDLLVNLDQDGYNHRWSGTPKKFKTARHYATYARLALEKIQKMENDT